MNSQLMAERSSVAAARDNEMDGLMSNGASRSGVTEDGVGR